MREKQYKKIVNSSHGLKAGASHWYFLIGDHHPLTPRPFCGNFRVALPSVELAVAEVPKSSHFLTADHRIGDHALSSGVPSEPVKPKPAVRD